MLFTKTACTGKTLPEVLASAAFNLGLCIPGDGLLELTDEA